MILNEEDYKYINVNGEDIEILILEETDNPSKLHSFMKDYPTVRAIITDKYYFWKTDILHDTVADKLKLSQDVENRFIIDGNIVDNSYILAFYDMCLDFGEVDKESEIAQAWKKNYLRLKEKFNVSLSEKDEKLLNDICEGNIELDEDLNDNFYKWFGKSKVVNPDGTPKIVSHRTNKTFDRFDKSKISSSNLNGKGFYFSASDDKGKKNSYGKNIGYYYLKMENPVRKSDWIDRETLEKYFEPDVVEYIFNNVQSSAARQGDKVKWVMVFFNLWNYKMDFGKDLHVTEVLKQMGYDGIIDDEIEDTYVVFEPNQIKSVDNKGNWSDSENIYEQLAYHGTRRNFDKFDLSKFQRGDYGYGVYFTWDKTYAGSYGEVGEYEIPDEKYLLDWDWGFGLQSDYIKDCLDKIYDEVESKDTDWKLEDFMFNHTGTGASFYYNIGEILKLNSKDTAKFLYEHGIKGVVTEKGKCWVIFNPDEIKTIYSKLNEELEKILEEAAMYKSNKPTFKDFYEYVIKNPKAKKSYYEFTSPYKLRIPSDTILHDYRKHGMTYENWDDCLSNLENIQNAGISTKKVSNEEMALIRVLGCKDYGVTIMLCKDYNNITTIFSDNPKMIDNWIKTGSRSHNVTQPTSNFRQDKPDSVVLYGLDPNEIIQHILEKIKR